jgi:hypothetical protein
MRPALAALFHVAALVIAWLGWLMIDWAGAESRTVILMAAAAGLLAVASWTVARKRALVITPAAVALLFVVATFVDISPVQPATRAVRRIAIGMTEAEVRAILDSEFPRYLRPAGIGRPVGEDTLSFSVGTGPRHNAAVVYVRFLGDRVASAKFLADSFGAWPRSNSP